MPGSLVRTQFSFSEKKEFSVAVMTTVIFENSKFYFLLLCKKSFQFEKFELCCRLYLLSIKEMENIMH